MLNLPIPWSHLCVPTSPTSHPTPIFLRQFYITFWRHSQSTIWLISKEEKTYLVFIADNPHHTCPNFVEMISMVVGKRGHWMPCKQLYYVFMYLCKVDYAIDKFIHTSAFSYNEVMCLLELVGVVEQSVVP